MDGVCPGRLEEGRGEREKKPLVGLFFSSSSPFLHISPILSFLSFVASLQLASYAKRLAHTVDITAQPSSDRPPDKAPPRARIIRPSGASNKLVCAAQQTNATHSI